VKNPSVIIIKKERRDDHGGHHGGAWKVAYADFVTAMMAFFLVMWLVAQSNSVKAAVAGYFKDPGIFDYEKSNGVIPGGGLKIDPETPEQIRVTPADPATAEAGRKALERAAERLKHTLSAMPEFEALQKQIEIELTPEGLRIELVEGQQSTFFDSGSATLKGETERVLGTIAVELGKLANTVVIEGHTDSTPYSASTAYTNWELSADRANAARRVMERLGLGSHQVQAVRGFADRQPRADTDSSDARNRRVSIVVQNPGAAAPTQVSSSDLTKTLGGAPAAGDASRPAAGRPPSSSPSSGGH
jgi:chemotaxis protein MotB